MNEQEARAAIRLIGAVVRADGKITDEEKVAFRDAVRAFDPGLVEDTTLERLLAEEGDIDADLAVIRSPIVQRAVFDAAYGISIADGRATDEENQLLARIRAAFSVEGEPSALAATLSRQRTRTMADPVLDPTDRTQRVRAYVARRAVGAAIFGALPLPLVSDIGVLVQLDSVITGVSAFWGHAFTRKEKLATFGAVLGLAMAQGAVHSLVKMIPGWGSAAGAVSGTLGAYVVTKAMGEVVNHHFEREGKTTAAELRAVFAERRTAAKSSFETDRAGIEAARDAHADELAALTKQLEADEITVEEFDAKVDALIRNDA